jgi:hypothetical protein
MSNQTSTIERPAALGSSSSIQRSISIYSKEQQEQLLILQAEIELLLIQIQTQMLQPALVG